MRTNRLRAGIAAVFCTAVTMTAAAEAAPFRIPSSIEGVVREVTRHAGSSGTAADPSMSAGPRRGEYVLLENGPMREFPYIGMPPGYNHRSYTVAHKTLARFPFWVHTKDESRSHWVEGRFLAFSLRPDPGKSFSEYEVKKYVGDVVREMGGSKLSESTVPAGELHAWGPEIRRGFIAGLGDVRYHPTSVYRIPRGGNDIWVHLVTRGNLGRVIIGEGHEIR